MRKEKWISKLSWGQEETWRRPVSSMDPNRDVLSTGYKCSFLSMYCHWCTNLSMCVCPCFVVWCSKSCFWKGPSNCVLIFLVFMFLNLEAWWWQGQAVYMVLFCILFCVPGLRRTKVFRLQTDWKATLLDSNSIFLDTELLVFVCLFVCLFVSLFSALSLRTPRLNCLPGLPVVPPSFSL